MSTSKKNHSKILIICFLERHNMRATVRDLTYCYQKYSDAYCYYLNLADYIFHNRSIANYFKYIEFDLIIFHTTFLSLRWGDLQTENYFTDKVCGLISFLRDKPFTKIAMPQDEWIHLNQLCRFINDFGISYVFSVAPPSEWEKIYESVDFSKVKFHEVLTGYIDDNTSTKIGEIIRSITKKTIDIGYRAYKAPYWLGSHGYLKTQIAEIFKQDKISNNFKIDISTEDKDTILGDEWYQFMASCKYMIGVEGGATVIDRDGEVWKKGTEYLKNNPQATYQMVESKIFPNMDNNLSLKAISPRNLEACITQTCQVLVVGNYNGILKPNEHYIPLNPDFSNLDEVIEKMKDEELRKKIVEKAYADIVLSRKYHYQALIETVLTNASPLSKSKLSPTDTYYYCYNYLSEMQKQIMAISGIDKLSFKKWYLKYTDGMGWRYGLEKALVTLLSSIGVKRLKDFIFQKNVKA